MPLSGVESRKLDEIARGTTADDPEYARRLSAFGGYEGSPLGLPTRLALLPVVLVGVLLALGLLAVSVAGAKDPGGAGAGTKAPHARLQP